jgi:hypothetical protein
LRLHLRLRFGGRAFSQTPHREHANKDLAAVYDAIAAGAAAVTG